MITLKLTDQQADQVLNALAMRPFIEVQGIIQDVAQQVQAQKQAAQQPQTGLGTAIAGAPLNGAGADAAARPQ